MAKVRPFLELTDKTEIAICVNRTFKPLTISLQIWGLYIPNGRKGVPRWLQVLYSIIIVSTLWANVIRIGIIFKSADGFSESLTTTSSLFLMYFGIAYIATAMLTVTSRKLDSLLDTMINYHIKYGFAYNVSTLRMLSAIFFIMVPISSSLSTAAISYIWSNPVSEMRRYLYPFETSQATGSLPGKIVLGVFITFAGCVMYMAIMTFGTFCYCLSKEFDAFNSLLRESKNNGTSEYDDLRLHHSDICRVLTEANVIITHILFPILAVTLPITCLLLYGVIIGSLPIQDLLFILCFVLSLVSVSFAIIIAAALLNMKAHGSLDDLMCLRLKDLPPETIQIITVFTTRLTGPPIGFHVYGLFIIDTSTILTIVGTLLTYAVVVIQFKPD